MLELTDPALEWRRLPVQMSREDVEPLRPKRGEDWRSGRPLPLPDHPVFNSDRASFSGGDCCSTGWQLHSFFSRTRMQLEHLPCGSPGARKHLTFRLRQ